MSFIFAGMSESHLSSVYLREREQSRALPRDQRAVICPGLKRFIFSLTPSPIPVRPEHAPSTERSAVFSLQHPPRSVPEIRRCTQCLGW